MAEAAAGVNVTAMLQLPPAATEVQVFVCANCAALVPEIAMPLTVSVAPPVLPRDRFIAAEGLPAGVAVKLRKAGVSVAVGSELPVPVPVWVPVCEGEVPPLPQPASRIKKVRRNGRALDEGIGLSQSITVEGMPNYRGRRAKKQLEKERDRSRST